MIILKMIIWSMIIFNFWIRKFIDRHRLLWKIFLLWKNDNTKKLVDRHRLLLIVTDTQYWKWQYILLWKNILITETVSALKIWRLKKKKNIPIDGVHYKNILLNKCYSFINIRILNTNRLPAYPLSYVLKKYQQPNFRLRPDCSLRYYHFLSIIFFSNHFVFHRGSLG